MPNSSQNKIIRSNEIDSSTVIKGGYYNAATRVAAPIMTNGEWGTAKTLPNPPKDKPNSSGSAPIK